MRTVFLTLTLLAAATATAQTAAEDPAAAELRTGKGFISTPVFAAEEDQKILQLFDGLRVADVSDGMDVAGRSVGRVRQLWR
jgi:4-hydroxy-4-methyl-2-oxoglutarate aldolase